jgi:FixJ family two-component response regulator
MINQDPKTVYVVDSDYETRQSVARLAGDLGFRCTTYPSGTSFLNSFRPSITGCVVLELVLPDMSGLTLQSRIAEIGRPTIPAIFLTSHSTVRSAVRAIRMGAIHFLEKPLPADELREAIYEAISIDCERLPARCWNDHIHSRLEYLTMKEEEVLRLIWQGGSTREIADELDVTVRTVELRRAKLLKKLEVDSVAKLQRFGQQIGLNPTKPFTESTVNARNATT